ncbi:hypothetical protein Sarmat_00374 [Rickettsiales endosymbiont of Paramecium tredecaurelia]|uniref:hypothetical protein n=1 Tax=Candidatus Sarmatiella mevalonica TaxID=2770581 RepID=UPI001923DBB5|nr:hypothetical protein [Candidatus Sarmatiella mevalonica]MBL3284526.1 hypothetical protein [Candidatus Sarmatiella mevalonica]
MQISTKTQYSQLKTRSSSITQQSLAWEDLWKKHLPRLNCAMKKLEELSAATQGDSQKNNRFMIFDDMLKNCRKREENEALSSEDKALSLLEDLLKVAKRVENDSWQKQIEDDVLAVQNTKKKSVQRQEDKYMIKKEMLLLQKIQQKIEVVQKQFKELSVKGQSILEQDIEKLQQSNISDAEYKEILQSSKKILSELERLPSELEQMCLEYEQSLKNELPQREKIILAVSYIDADIATLNRSYFAQLFGFFSEKDETHRKVSEAHNAIKHYFYLEERASGSIVKNIAPDEPTLTLPEQCCATLARGLLLLDKNALYQELNQKRIDLIAAALTLEGPEAAQKMLDQTVAYERESLRLAEKPQDAVNQIFGEIQSRINHISTTKKLFTKQQQG